MRPILLPLSSVNQRLLSGPAVIPYGALLAVGAANSVTLTQVVRRPIWLRLTSVNQRLPSGPTVISFGLPLVGGAYSVTVPVGVLFATAPLNSVNQRLPSGRAVIPFGPLLAVGTANSVKPTDSKQR